MYTGENSSAITCHTCHAKLSQIWQVVEHLPCSKLSTCHQPAIRGLQVIADHCRLLQVMGNLASFGLWQIAGVFGKKFSEVIEPKKRVGGVWY